MECGAQCVMTTGTRTMLTWSAINWASLGTPLPCKGHSLDKVGHVVTENS